MEKLHPLIANRITACFLLLFCYYQNSFGQACTVDVYAASQTNETMVNAPNAIDGDIGTYATLTDTKGQITVDLGYTLEAGQAYLIRWDNIWDAHSPRLLVEESVDGQVFVGAQRLKKQGNLVEEMIFAVKSTCRFLRIRSMDKPINLYEVVAMLSDEDCDGIADVQAAKNPPSTKGLIHFELSPQVASTKLSWSVADSQQYSHFEVEHSIDGRTFEKLATVLPQDNTQLAQHEFVATTSHSYNSYRVKMVDIDGMASFSDTKIALVEMPNQNQQLVISSNPLPLKQNLLELNIYTSVNEAQLEILDEEGNRVLSLSGLAIEKGWNKLKLNVADLPANIYQVRLIEADTLVAQQDLYRL